MRNPIQFKIRGVDRLLTYEQLVVLGRSRKIDRVRVIDIATQKNWETNIKTVIAKFR